MATDAASLRLEIQQAEGGFVNANENSDPSLVIQSITTLGKICYDPLVPDSTYTVAGLTGNAAATTILDTRVFAQNSDAYSPLQVLNLTLQYTSSTTNNTPIFRSTLGGDSMMPIKLDTLKFTGQHGGWTGNGNTYMSLSSFKAADSSPTSNIYFTLNNSMIDVTGQANFNSTTGAGGAAFIQSWNNSGTTSLTTNIIDESGFQSSFHFASQITNTGGGSQHGMYLISGNNFNRASKVASSGLTDQSLFRARGNRLENVNATVTGNTFRQGSYLDLYGDVSNITVSGGNTFSTIYGTTPTSPTSPSCGIRFNKTSSSGATLSGTSGISTKVTGNIFNGTGLAIVNNDSTANSIIAINSTSTNTVRLGTSTPSIFQTFRNMYAAGKGADTMNYSSSTTTNWISGDQGNDTITGGTVNDYIIGGVGSDTISTGTGTDTVIYYNPNEGGDTIATGGFTAASDKLAFLSSNFGGITSLTLNTNFFTGAPPSISGTSPLFFYNTTTGVLTYDSNGVSAGGDTVIATFAGTPPILGVTNFQFFS
jgi:hypothetical protein